MKGLLGVAIQTTAHALRLPGPVAQAPGSDEGSAGNEGLMLMTLLMVAVAVLVMVVLIGAAWERWRTERRAAERPVEFASVRFRCRPADRRTEHELMAVCEDMGFAVTAPVWGDRWHLVEGPRRQMTVVAERLHTAADASGFSVVRTRGRRSVLRRGLRLMTIEF